MRKLLEELPFEIAARVPIQLGRESISSSNVAISELVKNSYDADANNVYVRFLEHPTKGPYISIEDDGEGMELETIRKFWLKIGSDFKTKQKRSKNQRVYTGAKGLGRLGLDRLCMRALIHTKTNESDLFLEVDLDWSKYESEGASLSDIKHSVYQTSLLSQEEHRCWLPDNKKSGTRLLLFGLKDRWDEGALEKLNQELSLLVSPFNMEGESFSIALDTPFENVNGNLSSSEMLENARWTVEAELSEDGIVTTSFVYSKTGQRFEGSAYWKDWIKGRLDDPRSGPLKLKIYFIPWESGEDTSFKDLDLKKKNWKDFMDSNQGVRIYRDNFRVKPYGDPSGKGDWLDLGLRKSKSPGGVRQGGFRVGPHQVVGAVFISRLTNLALEDQTNREGIIETAGFFDMKAFVSKVIDQLEFTAHEVAKKEVNDGALQQARETAREAKEKYDQSAKKFEDRVKDISHSKVTKDDLSSTENAHIIKSFFQSEIQQYKEDVEEAFKATEKLEKELSQVVSNLEAEKNTLANLASIGILTVCFGHESSEYTNLAANTARLLKKSFERGQFMVSPDLQEQFLDDIQTIIDSTSFVQNFASFAIDNVKPDKRKQKKLDLPKITKQVFSAIDESLERQNISFEFETTSNVGKVRGFEIDWESVVTNLITNSIWALEKTTADQRLILVRFTNVEDQLVVSFQDSGRGLESGTENSIFETQFTTKRDGEGKSIGTGMGLSIVKTFIENHFGGEISAKQYGSLGGAELLIKLPLAK